jgi:hypothetical protein
MNQDTQHTTRYFCPYTKLVLAFQKSVLGYDTKYFVWVTFAHTYKEQGGRQPNAGKRKTKWRNYLTLSNRILLDTITVALKPLQNPKAHYLFNKRRPHESILHTLTTHFSLSIFNTIHPSMP